MKGERSLAGRQEGVRVKNLTRGYSEAWIFHQTLLEMSENSLISSVQFSSVTQSCPTICDTMNHSMPGLPVHSGTNSQNLLKLMPIKLVMPSSHLTLCCPLLLLPPIPPSIRVFSSESTLRMRWPKYWSFSFSISPSNEHPGLISFRMDWLDLLAVQGTLKSLLQLFFLQSTL